MALILSGDTGVPASGMPTGSVLQVQQTVKTDTFSTTTYGSWVAVTGLSVSITPSASSNKILVSYNINESSDNTICYATIARDGTIIDAARGATAGSRPRVTTGANYGNYPTIDIGNYSFNYLDSPATTSSVTYQIYIFGAVSGTTYINRNNRDNDGSGFDPRGASNITVMEIKA